MSSSNVPAVLGKIAGEARTAERAVRSLNAIIKQLGPSIDKVIPAVDKLSAVFGILKAEGVTSFRDTARSAAGFSRTTIAAGDVASRSMAGVTRSLAGVRLSAREATIAVNGLATASRRVPLVRSGTVGGAAAAAGVAGGMSLADTGAFALAGTGLVAGGMLAGGVKGASQLQDATVQAAVALGRVGPTVEQTTKNMADLGDIAFRMSRITGQSIGDSMGVIASMGTSGITAEQIKTNWHPLAQFTDILHFSKKDSMDYTEAAKLSAGLIHDLRLGLSGSPEQQAAETAYGMGRIAQLGYLSPHSTMQVATQVRRMAPTLENVLPGTNKQKATQITEIAAWADRMGNLPFAGSAISQMVTQMIAPRSDRVLGSLNTLGVWGGGRVETITKGKNKGQTHVVGGRNLFFDEHTGQFDLIGALMQVAKTYKGVKDKGPIVEALLGNTQNAARIMQALSSPEALVAFARVQAQRKGMGDDPVAWMNATQTQLLGELSTQTGILTSNFKTLATSIASPLIPELTRLVTNLAELTGNLAGYFRAHPTQAKVAAYGLGGVAVAGGVAALSVGGLLAAGAVRGAIAPILRGLGIHGVAEGVTSGVVRAATWRAGPLGRVAAVAGKGGSIAARVGGGTLDLLGAGVLKRGFFGPLLEEITMLHASSITGALGLRVLGTSALRIGARAIPVVAQILLLVDTLTFLGKHSKDIGYLVGQAFVWMMRTIPGVIRSGTGLAVEAMRGLLTEIIGVLNPMNWVATIGAFIGGIHSAVQDANAKQIDGRALGGAPSPSSQMHGILHGGKLSVALPGSSWNRSGGLHLRGMATGGRTTADGLAYLHRNEVVINDRLTRRLDTLTRPTGASGRSGGSKHVHLTITIGGNGTSQFDGMSHRDLKRLSRMIAGAIGEDVEQDSRAGGAIPQLAGSSHYSVSKGRVT